MATAPSATGARPATSSLFEAPGGGHRQRRHWQVVQGHQQLLGVHGRRPGADPARRRHPAQHGVRAVPPDGHGLAAQRQGHPRHRVGAWRRRDPHELRASSRFMFDYIPEVFKASSTRTTEEEGDRWYTDAGQQQAARLSSSPATRSRARSTPRSRPAAAHRTAGSSSTSPSACRPRRSSVKKLPSMWHQFKELADVDITTRGDGGRSDLPLRDGRHRGRARTPGRHPARAAACSRPVRHPAACTARTAWAATRSPTSWSSGRRAGLGAAELRRRARRQPSHR